MAPASRSPDPKWRTAAELLGGTVGGVAQAVSGHPLDTIKVRLQASNTAYAGAVDCARQTLRNEGVRGFFRGLSSPLVSMGILNAAIFTLGATSKRVVAWAAGFDSVKELRTPHVIASAWLTAPFYCLFVCPVDVVKNRLQIQTAEGTARYSGPIDCIVKRRDGNAK